MSFFLAFVKEGVKSLSSYSLTDLPQTVISSFSLVTYSGSLPFRFAGAHLCYDSPMLRPIVSLLAFGMGQQGRIRFRSHYGSHFECLYALSSFGIQSDYFPLQQCTSSSDYVTDELHVENHLEFLKKRNQIEQTSSAHHHNDTNATSICSIAYPSSNDVLLGRGRPYHEFPGNVRLAQILEEYRDRYQKASTRKDKTAMSNMIVNMIREKWDGRFLTRLEKSDDDCGWFEVSDSVAKEKVSHGFRTRYKKVKGEINKESTIMTALFPNDRTIEDTSTSTTNILDVFEEGWDEEKKVDETASALWTSSANGMKTKSVSKRRRNI